MEFVVPISQWKFLPNFRFSFRRMIQILNSLSKYLKGRIKTGKKAERIQYLIFLVLGISIITWKQSLETALLTVFTFFSIVVFAQLISQPLYYLTNFQKKSTIEKGRVYFTWILLTVILILQLVLWSRAVFIISVIMGIIYGIIIFILIKFRR